MADPMRAQGNHLPIDAGADFGVIQAGLTRHVDIGLRLAAAPESATVLAKSLASLLDAFEGVPVRLAGLGLDHGRAVLTIAVTLGRIEEVKAAGPSAVHAMELIKAIVTRLDGYDPAFAVLPDPQSVEANLARGLVRDGESVRSGLTAWIG